MTSHETSKSPAFSAILCMLAGVTLLSVNDALIKSLTSGYPVGQLLFVRGLFVLPWVLVLAKLEGGLHTLRIHNIKGQALRSVCVIVSSFLFVTGLSYLPLADAIAISFAGPLFITALAPIVLSEFVGWRRWLAVLVGFAGVLCMIRPGSGAMQWAVLFPLCATLAGVGRDLITRRMARSETTVAVLCATTVVVLLAGLTTAPLGWVRIDPADLWLFTASGALIAGAHYLMIESFRRGEAALVAPFKYASMIWAVLFGYLFFGDLPDQWTIAGASIVISAGLYILHREAVRARTTLGH